jgi:hypothetical protein
MALHRAEPFVSSGYSIAGVTSLCGWIESVGQVWVEKHRANERLELIKSVMVAHELIVHKVYFAPMRLELNIGLRKMFPETLQVCQDFFFLGRCFADISQVHEVEFDDVIQAWPIPRRHEVMVCFGELDFNRQIGPTL